MYMEQSQSDFGQNHTQNNPASIENLRHSNEGSAEYDVLLRKYGEAMLRISQLESQLDGIARDQQEGNASSHSSSDVRSGISQPETVHALNRIEELETRAGSEREVVTQERSTQSPLNGADVAQLRLQVTSLANKLAQTEDELKSSQGTRVKRRSHHKHKNGSTWAFWRGSKRR